MPFDLNNTRAHKLAMAMAMSSSSNQAALDAPKSVLEVNKIMCGQLDWPAPPPD